MTEPFTIRDLAEEFGVTTRAIRFYEDQGLLAPRREGQRRLFCARDRVRLKLILRGRRLGFPLAEVAEIVALYDAAPGEVGQLQTLIERIARRREELLAKRRDINASLADLQRVAEDCAAQLAELSGAEEGAVAKANGELKP
jgi:DNA-binding transcriptional MerR regulator